MENDKKILDGPGTIYLDDNESFDDVVVNNSGHREILVDNSKNNEERLKAEAQVREDAARYRKNEKISKIVEKMAEMEEEKKSEEISDEDIRLTDNEDISEEPEKVEEVSSKVSESKDDELVIDPIMNMVDKDISKKKQTESLNTDEADSIVNMVDFSGIFERTESKDVTPTDEDMMDQPRKKAKKVDLSSITIGKTNELERERDLKVALYGNKASFQIVCAQSGYMAKIIPLVSRDIYNIINSSLNRYEYRREIYKIVYQKMIEMNCGKVDFDTFLKMTSVEDAETCYYGLYCSTFQNSGQLSFECPYCDETNIYTISNNSLVTTTNNEEMRHLIGEISRNVTNFDDVKNYTMIGKYESFELSDSGIICELRTPSLYDSLELLRTFPEEVIDNDRVSITNMLYINRILIPSRNDPGKTVYSEETNRKNILKIIDMLSIDDGMELQNSISERLDAHRITYCIKNLKCPKCGKVVPEVPVNLEDLLFTAIYVKSR